MISTFLFISLLACASTSEKKSTIYEVVLSDSFSNWERIEKDLADHAFRNPKSGSILVVNSNCKKYNNTSLRNMYFDLFPTSKETKVLSEEFFNIHNREALKVNSSVSTDGVNRYLSVTIFKRNRCSYDFILITDSQRNLEKDSKFVTNLIKGIKFED